jgi:hypothetical protein
LEPQLAPRPLQFDHDDLPSSDSAATTFAAPSVVKRMPEMEFVEVTQEVELIFGREQERGGSAHATAQWQARRDFTIGPRPVARISRNPIFSCGPKNN